MFFPWDISELQSLESVMWESPLLAENLVGCLYNIMAIKLCFNLIGCMWD